jgi:hypothetical protein
MRGDFPDLFGKGWGIVEGMFAKTLTMSWRNQIDPSCLVFSKKIANLPACNIFNVRTEFKLHLKKRTVADKNMAAQTPMV